MNFLRIAITYLRSNELNISPSFLKLRHSLRAADRLNNFNFSIGNNFTFYDFKELKFSGLDVNINIIGAGGSKF